MPAKEQTILRKLSEMDADARNNTLMNVTVADTVETILKSVEDDDVKLKVNKVWVDKKYDNSDISAQKIIRNKGRIWSNDLRADLSIVDKTTGKVIDRVPNIKVTTIPKITDRGTYLIKGNEYQFTKQSRLKPGVYTKQQANGEISSFFNVDKTVDFDRGFNNNFKINFIPERKTFTMGYGSKNIPLINALKAVGVTRNELIERWGEQVYEANAKAYDKHETRDQNKLYEAIFGKQPDAGLQPGAIRKEIKDRLFDTGLDPETTKITLGTSYKNVNKDVLLDASKKIIDIHSGKVEGDDREALVFKSFYDVEDHIREKLVKNSKKITNNIKYKLKKNRTINTSISSQIFDPFVVGVLTNSQLSNPPSQTNLMSIIGESNKYTIMGEGGIGTSNAITNETRQISNGEAGYFDPLHTPEGPGIGVAVHSTMDAIKVGTDIYSKHLTPSGEKVLLKPTDTWDKNIAFPDEYDLSGEKPKPKNKIVKAIIRGKLAEIAASKIDAIISSPVGMFDTSANSIPFLNSIQGNRGLTAAKMQEQALPLKDRDKPLFNIVDEKGRGISNMLAGSMALPKSPVDGEVTKVTSENVTVTDKKGEKHRVQLYNNFSMNSESFLHNTPVVQEGDKVKSGNLLADNNFTKDGQVAIGANLRTAYLPYKGYNYEDSAIMSESGAKKLTSEHMYDFKTKRSAKGVFSRDKYKAYYPEELNAAQGKKLDKDGVIRIGQKVDRDDVLIAHMEHKPPTADDVALGRLDKQLKKDMSNNALKWDKDVVGVVTNVEKSGNSVVVSVKTEEQLKVADKISGLHGNKHIISKIVPDSEMPFNPETGEHIELTMNPIGVSNRINTSQLLENAAGKIAAKTGEQYKINNFSGEDNSKKIMADLKKAGISDKDILVDPETGKPLLNPVANGISNILKLEHVVDHKFSARYRDGYDANEQPTTGGKTGGKNLGRMEMSALLARGATENLREMFEIKGQKNDEYWKAMEAGQSLPPPKKAFVWDKMLAMMAGAGIDVEQKGKTFALRPMTDDEIVDRSRGEIKRPDLTYRKKDLAPMKEGLFDPIKAGGLFGDHYTHFKLSEKVLNPITASAAAALIGLPVSKMNEVIAGKKFVDKTTGELVKPGSVGAISGSPAIELLLERIKVDKELANTQDISKHITNPSELNKAHRKIRYLKSLKENNMKPTDYMVSNVLVTPSKYRPVVTMGTDNTVILSDINDLYQQTSRTSSALKDLKKQTAEIGSEDIENLQLAEIRGALYADMKAIAGLGEPTSYLHRVKNKKGFITQIDGGKTKQTKEGFFQDKVLERRQDLVGRSTIILNPQLGGDEIGIPKDMAGQMFQPFIMQKMVSWGYKPLEAQKHIKDKSPIFERARQVVADERLVIANRAPTLHRWNMTAFKPKLTDGKSIEVPAVVVSKNFGGDFDGDSSLSSMFISININKLQEEINLGKNILFGRDFEFDKNNDMYYITSILKQMEVNVPYIGKMVALNDSEIIAHIHISCFPRVEDSKKTLSNGNEEYSVPDGIDILTLDNSTHEFKKVKVDTFSVHKNLFNYTVETSSGDSLLLSCDQSAVAVNNVTFEIEKVTPENLKNGKLIPKIRKIDIHPSVFEIELIDYLKGDPFLNAVKCKEKMLVNEEYGWLIGAMVGDGWVSITNNNNQLCLSSSSKKVGKEFEDLINSLMSKPIVCNVIDSPHKFDEFDSFSTKYVMSTASLAKNFIPLIGSGAENKHLPPFFLATSEEFRLGLLSGLIDTDGTVGWLAKKKNKRQFNAQYSTISERLADEVVTLCRSLGISASITFGNKTPSGVERRVVMSTNTLHGKPLNLRNKVKKDLLDEFYSTPIKDSSVSARQDIVPFSPELFMISKEFVHHVKNKDIYRNINDSKRNNWRISRQSAHRLIELDVDNKLPVRWKEIVYNEDVTWVYAKNVILNSERVDMYDITAPGPYTFMLDNGIIVQDTFQIHTPVGPKALREAEKMKPSASMLKTGYDSVLNLPEMDMVAGSWLVSKGKGGKDTGLKFKDIDEAKYAFNNHKFTYADNVEIDGKKAPFGMHEINSAVPDDMKDWDVELNSKNVEGWINKVTKKHNGKIALGLADKIKDVGNNYVTQYGFTLGVSDTLVDESIRKPLIQGAKQQVIPGSDSSVIKAYSSAKEKGQKALEKRHGDKTMIGIGLTSGAGKGIENTASISFMPGIITDANDKPIPIPIEKSYSEGLDTFGYWAAAHGARGGSIKKSVSSFKPGWLTKDLMNSIYDTRVYSDDPVDVDGLEYNIDDKKAVMNRYLARDVKDTGGKVIAKRNELVNSDVINKVNQHKIKKVFIQSPLTDPSPGDGFSSWSYGTDHEGKRHNIGDNIGIISAHTLTEPSLNLAMKAFHTGGALEAGKKSAGTKFDVLDRTLRFTKNIPDKATLSSMDGFVKTTSKSPIGGWDVVLSDGVKEETRYIDTNNDLLVKKGDKVRSGDKISSGTTSAHDILKYKGMKETQRFLVDQISEINEGKLDSRDIETIVRGITNTTRVIDPGSSNYTPHDVAQLSSVEHYNKINEKEEDVENSEGDHLAQSYGRYKKHKKIDRRTMDDLGKQGNKRIKVFKDRIKHEPFLTPAGISAKAQSSEDWVARLAHNRIKKVLEEGTTQGWKTTIDPVKGHPLPMYVTGEYSW